MTSPARPPSAALLDALEAVENFARAHHLARKLTVAAVLAVPPAMADGTVPAAALLVPVHQLVRDGGTA